MSTGSKEISQIPKVYDEKTPLDIPIKSSPFPMNSISSSSFSSNPPASPVVQSSTSPGFKKIEPTSATLDKAPPIKSALKKRLTPSTPISSSFLTPPLKALHSKSLFPSNTKSESKLTFGFYNLVLCLRLLLLGIRDAFSIAPAFLTIYQSKTIQIRTVQCFILNGLIFLGSIFLFDHVVLPAIQFILGWMPGMSSMSSDNQEDWKYNTINSLLTFVYQVFWVYPMYSISFVLNSLWYQEIADKAYEREKGKTFIPSFTYDRLLTNLAAEIYRSLLFFNYILFTSLISFVPYLGLPLSFCLLSWIYSFYTFEYGWIHKGWSMEVRMNFVEGKWAYFLGFGFPSTFMTFFFPQFISGGIFALLFPLLILIAVKSQPLPKLDLDRKKVSFPFILPIFWIPKRMNEGMIQILGNSLIPNSKVN